MKTTLDIPEELLAEALRLTNSRTKREVVIRALEDLTHRAKMAALARDLGQSDTFMSPEELQAIRAMETPRWE